MAERISRRNIGRGRALADHDSDADTPQIGAAARREVAGLLQLRHQRTGHDNQIGRPARRDDCAQLARGADGKLELVAGLARVVVNDLRDQPAHRTGRNDLEIGGGGWGGEQR
jgi:hypothetical protein